MVRQIAGLKMYVVTKFEVSKLKNGSLIADFVEAMAVFCVFFSRKFAITRK